MENSDPPVLYRQCTLIQGTAYRAAWLPSRRLKVGMRITLKGDESSGIWEIHGIGKIEMPRNALHTDWNNNI